MPLSPSSYTVRHLGDMCGGDHVCYLCTSEEEKWRVLCEYYRVGLENNERMMFFQHSTPEEEVLRKLEQGGVKEIRECVARGQFTVHHYADVYMTNGKFDPANMIALLKFFTEQCVAEGYSCLRACGDMSWIHREINLAAQLLNYESSLNDGFPINYVALCLYDVHAFKPADMLQVLATHPQAIINEKLLQNIYYMPPGDYLGPDLDRAMLNRWMHNIEERRIIEEQLIAARIDAERAASAKANFLATMSHEIRNPTNGIIGSADMLAQTNVTPEQSEYISILQSSAKHLYRVVNDILDFSKIESGRLELSIAPLVVKDLLEDARSLCQYSIQKNLAVSLRCDVHPECPKTIVGDKTRLRQILVNLIGNACKFTEEGEVVVSVAPVAELDEEIADDRVEEIEGKGGGEGKDREREQIKKEEEQHREKIETEKVVNYLEFSVSDSGVGISPEDLSKLFTKFTQIDVTQKWAGTGLGLAICKQLVEAMGGQILVKSELGKGSTFFFRVPTILHPPPPPRPPSSFSFSSDSCRLTPRSSSPSPSCYDHYHPLSSSSSSDSSRLTPRSYSPTPIPCYIYPSPTPSPLLSSSDPRRTTPSSSSSHFSPPRVRRGPLLPSSPYPPPSDPPLSSSYGPCHLSPYPAIRSLLQSPNRRSSSPSLPFHAHPSPSLSPCHSPSLPPSSHPLSPRHSISLPIPPQPSTSSDSLPIPISPPTTSPLQMLTPSPSLSSVSLPSDPSPSPPIAPRILSPTPSRSSVPRSSLLPAIPPLSLPPSLPPPPQPISPSPSLPTIPPLALPALSSLPSTPPPISPSPSPLSPSPPFPLTHSPSCSPPSSKDFDFSGEHILVVEDDVINQKILGNMLRKLKCEVTIASNGLEAINLAKENDYSLILTDQCMPECDGFAAMTQIRAFFAEGAQTHDCAATKYTTGDPVREFCANGSASDSAQFLHCSVSRNEAARDPVHDSCASDTAVHGIGAVQLTLNPAFDPSSPVRISARARRCPKIVVCTGTFEGRLAEVMDDILIKPVRFKTITEMLSRFCTNKAAS